MPPKIFGRGWPSYLAILMFVQFLVSQAGVISAAGLALSPGSCRSTATLTSTVVDRVLVMLTLVVIAIAIHIANRYEIVARGCPPPWSCWSPRPWWCWCSGIQATPFAWSGADIASGLQFQIAVGAMGVALSISA